MKMKFNINYWVRVKLTNAGRELHRKKHAEWFRKTQLEYTPPVEDEEGWSRWQMHDLMNIFGENVGIGHGLVFDPTIELEIPE